MKILIIDNFDSFTFNLYQYCGEILNKEFKDSSNEIIVKRNNQLTLDDITEINPNRIIISPGPGSPEQKKYFGICKDIILKFGPSIPLLGICLGMQGIVYAFGGKIIHAQTIMHGKTSQIHHNQRGVFRGLANPFIATRYHSLVIERESLPSCFEVTAWTDDQEIMGVRHKELAIEGVQFHPESILTQHGHDLLRNFIENDD